VSASVGASVAATASVATEGALVAGEVAGVPQAVRTRVPTTSRAIKVYRVFLIIILLISYRMIIKSMVVVDY
jgi:hypothetical protein